jgi:hypothetical protein
MGLSLIAGGLGAVLVRQHPVLAFIGFSAVAGNAHAVATGVSTWKKAAERLGQHAVATAGALALPKHPVIGYVAGAVAAELLIDDEGAGVLDEWAHRAGLHRGPEKVKAEVVEKTKPAQAALKA